MYISIGTSSIVLFTSQFNIVFDNFKRCLGGSVYWKSINLNQTKSERFRLQNSKIQNGIWILLFLTLFFPFPDSIVQVPCQTSGVKIPKAGWTIFLPTTRWRTVDSNFRTPMIAPHLFVWCFIFFNPPWNKQFAPENGWLEYYLLSYWGGLFSGATLVSGGVNQSFWYNSEIPLSKANPASPACIWCFYPDL